MAWCRIVVACAALVAAEAEGGAWTLAEGEGQAFFSTIRRVSPAGAQFGGVRDEDELFSAITLEYGIREDLTAGLKVHTKYDTARPEDVEIQAGGHLRYRVWQGEGAVASVQVGASFPVEAWFGSIGDAQPDSVPEVSVMALYGRGWQSEWGDGFLSAGFGGAWRGEGEASELRAEATVGQRPWRHFMGLLSVFAAVPLDGGDTSLKLAPSIAYTDWPWLGPNDKKPAERVYPNTVQIGVAWDALNPEDGLALTLNLWKGF